LQTSPTEELLLSVCFVNENKGWAAGENGTILRTTDGGINWILLARQFFDLNAVYFIDENTGWIVGDFIILRTTDGGDNWIDQTGDLNRSFYTVCFVDENTGWAAGERGTIVRTIDGGETWNVEPVRTLNGIHSVCFTGSGTGWAVGEKGTILKTANGGATSVADIYHSDPGMPDREILFRNYPNPFNSSTTIRFEIPESGFVTLKIYDLLGRETETLVNGPRSAGIHVFQWNAGNYSEGIYFCRLIVMMASQSPGEQIIMTKKLLLNK
ncbi:MAG: T9SS type A sorting domain-containing protein, partial [Bacteroidales bacterium]|nr:T9SS type A sorting domain-containing protein [Bacteroidales bacterium]